MTPNSDMDNSFSFLKPHFLPFIPTMHTTLLLLIKITVCIKSHNRTEARSLTGSTSGFEPKNFTGSKQRDDLSNEVVWLLHAGERRGAHTGIEECLQCPKQIKYLTLSFKGGDVWSLRKTTQHFHVL